MRYRLTKEYVYYRGKKNEQIIPIDSLVTFREFYSEDSNKMFVNYDNDVYLVHVKDLIMATER